MRPLTRLNVSLLLVLVCCWSGCGKKSEPAGAAPAAKPAPAAGVASPDYVVAKVNGTPLTWEEMDRRAMGYLKDDVEINHLVIPSNRLEEAREHFRRRAVNAFVFKTIMLDEALQRKIAVTEADRQAGLRALQNSLKARNWTTNDFFERGPQGPERMRREFEDGLIIDKLLAREVRDKIRVGEAELAEAMGVLHQTNRLRRARLEAVRKQLLDGADFADTARNVSECPSAANGGDLGEFARGKKNKPLEDAAFSQKVGEIGPVIETRFGYHIIKTTSRMPAKAATATTPAVPETVRAAHILIKSVPVNRKRLSDTILRRKYNAGVETFFAELKKKAEITCYLYRDMTF
ncbi:MAG: peptidylprolyl isomerase [Kiritimatiellia bacterium]|jgi:peptidyl-prolyl cis-trans isomerase C|nr:peptidylprolyl isomerase [Kiritimatiellia bacterium]